SACNRTANANTIERQRDSGCELHPNVASVILARGIWSETKREVVRRYVATTRRVGEDTTFLGGVLRQGWQDRRGRNRPDFQLRQCEPQRDVDRQSSGHIKV